MSSFPGFGLCVLRVSLLKVRSAKAFPVGDFAAEVPLPKRFCWFIWAGSRTFVGVYVDDEHDGRLPAVIMINNAMWVQCQDALGDSDGAVIQAGRRGYRVQNRESLLMMFRQMKMASV